MSHAAAKPTNATFSSRFAFIMAAVGVAVGLGNLWRFPFQVGQNGGAAFILVYLTAVAFIAWPILCAEIAIGRAGGRGGARSAVLSTARLGAEAGSSRAWGVLGAVGAMASLLVLSTYSNVAGQIMAFSVMAAAGSFAAPETADRLDLYQGATPVLWYSLFLGLTIAIVARGLRGGVERIVTVLMPLFFLLLAALCVYALIEGAPAAAIDYLVRPDFSLITPAVLLAALGQAFFSISVGSAAMITYGAYLDKKSAIAGDATLIAGADTLVALVAGLMIFPVVFAHNVDPAAGMGLIFEALPFIFAGMPGGNLIGAAFFFLAFIAALTTSISMLLIGAAIAGDWLGWSQTRASLVIGGIVWAVGVAAMATPGAPEAIDFVAGNVLLPVGGLIGAIFAGWILPRALTREELNPMSDGGFAAWRFLIRWACPLAVTVILGFGVAAQFGG